MVTHTFNLSTFEAEAGLVYKVPRQPGLQREPVVAAPHSTVQPFSQGLLYASAAKTATVLRMWLLGYKARQKQGVEELSFSLANKVLTRRAQITGYSIL